MRILSGCLLFAILTATFGAAQTTTATLYGVVRDSSGAVVPTAQVVATNVDTSFARTATTDETGAYLITNLPVGSYSITTEKPGFRKFVQSRITLNVNDHARVDVTLDVGQVSENVSVTAQAIGVDTQSTSMGAVVDSTRVRELPLNGRNVMELARTVPGVARASAPTAVPQARGGPAAARILPSTESATWCGSSRSRRGWAAERW